MFGGVVVPVGLPRKQRRGIIAQIQGYKCAHCGGRLQMDKRAEGWPGSPTLEHVKPKGRGGGNYGNLLVTHKKCNHRKADAKPTGCELIMLDFVNTRLGITS